MLYNTGPRERKKQEFSTNKRCKNAKLQNSSRPIIQFIFQTMADQSVNNESEGPDGKWKNFFPSPRKKERK